MPPAPPPPLVPPVAELLLLQRLELAALARLDRFVELNPQVLDDDLGPMERDLLERWALDHVAVTELFEQIAPEQDEPVVAEDLAPPEGPTKPIAPPGGGPDPEDGR